MGSARSVVTGEMLDGANEGGDGGDCCGGDSDGDDGANEGVMVVAIVANPA